MVTENLDITELASELQKAQQAWRDAKANLVVAQDRMLAAIAMEELPPIVTAKAKKQRERREQYKQQASTPSATGDASAPSAEGVATTPRRQPGGCMDRVMRVFNGHPLRIDQIRSRARIKTGSLGWYLHTLKSEGLIEQVAKGVYQKVQR
jgi:hypothetical protein